MGMSKREAAFVWVGQASATEALLRTVVGARARVVTAKTIDGAVDACARYAVHGIAMEGSPGTRVNASVLDVLRRAAPLADIVYVASELSAELLNTLQPLRIQVLAYPLPNSVIETFVERSLHSGRVPEPMLRASIDQLRVQYQLNGRDVALVPMLLEAESELAAKRRLGMDSEALQRSVRRLVRKCHMRNPERLANSVLRDALFFARGFACPPSYAQQAVV
jgi:hypothetical protein